MTELVDLVALDILARTIYGEARGEPRETQKGVAAVVMNRVRSAATWWGHDVVSVCLWPYQFSCWNSGDPNRAILLRPSREDGAFVRCWYLARNALSDPLADDPTGGATHYHTAGITLPDWAASMEQSAVLGRLVFYRPKSADRSGAAEPQASASHQPHPD